MRALCCGCLQARLSSTQTVQDLLKLTEALQAEKRRLQGREQKDGSEKQRLQQALADLRAATSKSKVGRVWAPPNLLSNCLVYSMNAAAHRQKLVLIRLKAASAEK